MILYGASGHAKVIIDILSKRGDNIELVFDDNPNVKELLSYSVSAKYDIEQFHASDLIISIGNNVIRKKISYKVKHSFGKAVHSNAVVADSVVVCEGSVIFANVVVQSSTTIGKHVIINTRASVDHDCNIGDFVHIAPGATVCGGVVIGEGAFVGAGAIVIPNISIGKWATIGAGAVVMKNIGNNETWVGNPARRIK